MKFKKEIIEDIRSGKLSLREAFEKHQMFPEYYRKIKKGHVRKNIESKVGRPSSRYKTTKYSPLTINSADPVYPFGLYPKVKYEVFVGTKIIYSFVTTIHDEEKCKKILLEKVSERLNNSTPRAPIMYKNIDGIKTQI